MNLRIALLLALPTLSCTGAATTLAAHTASYATHTASNSLKPTAREQLAAHRELEIARLHAYAEAGQFPVNTPAINQAHMFKDPLGHLCAVANLIHADGHDDVVDEVARTNNGLVVDGLKSGPVVDWVVTSGLTQDEVARIQAPAPMIGKMRRPPSNDLLALLAPVPTEAEMVASLRARFAKVEHELRDQTQASLDKAVERLVAVD